MAIKTWQKYVIAIVPIIIVGAILSYFSEIVSYIVIAWIVSMIGAPIFRLFNKFFNKSLSAGLSLFVLSLFMILLFRIFIPPLVNQAKNLAGIDYEEVISGLEEPINDMNLWLKDVGFIHSESFESEQQIEEDHKAAITTEVIALDSLLQANGDTLSRSSINLVINVNNPTHHDHTTETPSDQSYFEGLRSDVFEMFNPSQVQKLLSSFVGFFGGLLVTILSVFFIAFFFLKENGLFTRMVAFLVPNNQEGQVSKAIEESSTLLIRYFVGLVIQVTVLTILATIVLKIFGLKSALLMAFCFAVFNLIPYLGPLLGNFFGVLIVISSNLDVSFYDVMLPKIVTTIIVFSVLQLVDNFLLQPNIFSKSVKAHPLEIFIVVLMGAKIGGVGGMVLAIPSYTVIRVLLKVFFSEFEVVKKLTDGI